MIKQLETVILLFFMTEEAKRELNKAMEQHDDVMATLKRYKASYEHDLALADHNETINNSKAALQRVGGLKK